MPDSWLSLKLLHSAITRGREAFNDNCARAAQRPLSSLPQACGFTIAALAAAFRTPPPLPARAPPSWPPVVRRTSYTLQQAQARAQRLSLRAAYNDSARRRAAYRI